MNYKQQWVPIDGLQQKIEKSKKWILLLFDEDGLSVNGDDYILIAAYLAHDPELWEVLKYTVEQMITDIEISNMISKINKNEK